MKTLVPAYGRDYKSGAAVRKDWIADKDFVIADFFDRADGKPVNRSDAQRAAATDRAWSEVRIRFNRNAKFIVVKVTS